MAGGIYKQGALALMGNTPDEVCDAHGPLV